MLQQTVDLIMSQISNTLLFHIITYFISEKKEIGRISSCVNG